MKYTLPAVLAMASAHAHALERLAVVDVQAPPTMMALAAQVTRAVATAKEAQKYAIVSPNELRGRLGEEKYRQLQECQGRTACVTTMLGGVEVDRVVLGVLDRDAKSYLIKMWLIDVKRQRTLAEVDRAIFIASRRFSQDVNVIVPALLRGERDPKGVLSLTSTVKDVAVTMNGRPVGSTPLTLELTPGKYEVKLEKRSYMPVQRLVTVEANQTTHEEIRMILIPGATPEEEKTPALVRAAPEESFELPTSALVAGGAALTAGAVAVYFGVSSRRLESSLQAGFDPNRDAYEGTRREALWVRTQATYANVSWGVAGAATITAITLTVLHNRARAVGMDNAKEQSAGIAPWVSSGAGLVAYGRF